MITYEYKCEKCNHTFEEVRSINKPHPTECKELTSLNEICGGKLKQVYGTKNEHYYFSGGQRGAISKRFA